MFLVFVVADNIFSWFCLDAFIGFLFVSINIAFFQPHAPKAGPSDRTGESMVVQKHFVTRNPKGVIPSCVQ